MDLIMSEKFGLDWKNYDAKRIINILKCASIREEKIHTKQPKFR